MSDSSEASTRTAPDALEKEAIQAPTAVAPNGSRRKRLLLGLTVVLVLCGLAWGVYDQLVLAHFEETDNAYAQGNVVQITPQIGGTVTAIYADEMDRVQAGAPLVQLDGADARIALAQAEAALGQAVRQVRTLYVNNASLAAQVRLREADVGKARTQLASAEQDLARRQGLAGVLVEDVQRGSRAAQNGLQRGDVVLAASSGQFSDLTGFRAAVSTQPQQLVLRVLRGQNSGQLLMR